MIELNIKNSGISDDKLMSVKDKACSAYKTLMDRTGEGAEMLGWINLAYEYNKDEFARILDCAEKIKQDSKILICIGIGGSYLGARAGIEFCFGQYANMLAESRGAAQVYFVGNNISSSYAQDIIDIIGDKDFSINVISKSGTTTEPAVAFRIFKNLLEEKYGREGAKERIYCTTDANKGALHDFAVVEGYERFVVPDATGGRFSCLTAVGLLPMAVAGVDIKAVMQGCKDAVDKYNNKDFETNDTMKYAAMRYLMYKGGKAIEILANYEPSLMMFGEWFKQLMAESEGKDHKGIFPTSANFSTDLHSIGQFIQDGTRNLFETVLWVDKPNAEIKVPDDPENIDGLNFASNMSMQHINKQAMRGTLLAHVDGGCPNIVININKLESYTFGEMVFFFWKALAISAYMIDVNPFNQPGVEEYKKNMFALLGKPGFEDMQGELENRLSNVE